MSETITFLGTGTSTGVPQIGCTCPTCTSPDPHDWRLRASAIVNTHGQNLLIDCGPDFREQMLSHGSPDLRALLITHSHYDHVGGVDDLRPYCHPESFPVYCREDVAHDLRERVPYCFAKKLYPGVPTYDVHIIRELEPFKIDDIDILPLPVKHYRLDILGFRIGDTAYITDAKEIPQSTIDAISGIDTLVINALRHEEHLSHMSLKQSLEMVERIGPRRAFLTHMSHQMGRESDIAPTLPQNVKFAHDGLVVQAE